MSPNQLSQRVTPAGIIKRAVRGVARCGRLRIAALTVFLIAGGLTGCAGPDSDLRGQWVGTCSASPQASAVQAPLTLDFADDDTFTFTSLLVRRSILASGSYSTDDDQLSLTFTEPPEYRAFPGTGRYTVEDNTLTLSALQTGTTAMWCTLTHR